VVARTSIGLSPPRSLGWTGAAIAAGSVLGIFAIFSTRTAVVLAVVLVLASVVAIKPEAILAVLGFSVYLENLSIGGTTISRYVGVIALLVVVFELARGRAHVPRGKPLVFVCTYALWALASGLWTVDFSHTVQYGLGPLSVSLMYMIAFATLARTRADLDRALYALCAAAILTGLIALIGFARSNPLGYIAPHTEGNRAGGFTGDANFFAAYELFALPLLFVVATKTRKRGLRWLLLIGTIGVIGAIFASVSRGGIVTLTIMTMVLVVVPWRVFFPSRLHKVIICGLIAMSVAIALSVSYKETVKRYSSLFSGNEATGSGRLNEWQAAERSLKQRPVLGLGYGAFGAVSNNLVRNTPGADLVHFDLRAQGTTVHNAYLGSAAELGLPGALFFVGILISVAIALRRAARRARQLGDHDMARLAYAFLLALFGWATAAIFLSSETSRPLWVLVGATVAIMSIVRTSPQTG
jgi:O-antigen ligase